MIELAKVWWYMTKDSTAKWLNHMPTRHSRVSLLLFEENFFAAKPSCSRMTDYNDKLSFSRTCLAARRLIICCLLFISPFTSMTRSCACGRISPSSRSLDAMMPGFNQPMIRVGASWPWIRAKPTASFSSRLKVNWKASLDQQNAQG